MSPIFMLAKLHVCVCVCVCWGEGCVCRGVYVCGVCVVGYMYAVCMLCVCRCVCWGKRVWVCVDVRGVLGCTCGTWVCVCVRHPSWVLRLPFTYLYIEMQFKNYKYIWKMIAYLPRKQDAILLLTRDKQIKLLFKYFENLRIINNSLFNVLSFSFFVLLHTSELW